MGPELIECDEPETAQLRKAGEGAFWYALRRAGWTDEQIHNGLRSHNAGLLDEAAEWVADSALRRGLGWESARDVLTSKATEFRRGRTYGVTE
jgi:hypothetical protein